MYTCTYSKLASKLNLPKILLSTCLLFALRFTLKIQWFSSSSSIFIFPHFLFPISLSHFHFLFPFSFPFLFSLSHPFLSLLTSHSVSWWLLPQGLCTHVHVASLSIGTWQKRRLKMAFKADQWYRWGVSKEFACQVEISLIWRILYGHHKESCKIDI